MQTNLMHTKFDNVVGVFTRRSASCD